MKNYKNSFFYLIVVGIFSALIYWTLKNGKLLEKPDVLKVVSTGNSDYQDFLDSLHHNLTHPLAILLAQIVTIILVARFFGLICKKIGQPTVIGEIIAGIVLGPSFFGSYLPEFSVLLFPDSSLDNLKFLSQIGLIFFMFVVGMELDLKVLRNKAKEAVIISHASIIIPFTLGLVLAYSIYTNFAPKGVEFLSFGLFLGIAMSITAFPVLARIVQERGLQKTRIGAMVITCAAADDITAWCLLAGVIAIVKAGSITSSLYIIVLSFVYVVTMIKLVRPFLRRIGNLYDTAEKITKPVVAIFFLTLLISSYLTEIIGIHALFGAFVAGVIMPDNMKFRKMFIEKIEDVSLVVLLPLFFVFTGLRTEIGLLNSPELWKVCGLIILVAVVGKFIGSALAAKFVGQNWRDSLTIGALMNTRGLMELVVLNIGYDLGVLTKEVFAMMVIMALATTFMTGPALNLIDFVFKRRKTLVPTTNADNLEYKVLVSFENPEDGKHLLKVANNFISIDKEKQSITAMYISSTNEVNPYKIEEYERESFKPVLKEANKLNRKVETLFKASRDIDSDIVEVGNKGEFDLVLINIGSSIFEGTLLGKVLGITSKFINPENLLNTFTGKEKLFEINYFDDKTQAIINKTEVPLGIYVDKNLIKTENISVILFNAADQFLLDYVKLLKKNSQAKISIFDTYDIVNEENKITHENVKVIHSSKLEKDFLKEQDLLIMSIDSWKKLIDTRSVWLNNTPSLLIIKP
ncbi:cation/H(+) antiporter [Flavobacterium sp. F372]|uniref:Cation:proton antiporter n=1 Tax=Flavobacterium bernardetii TaxID=2813823 RepID=A0ABR7IWE7_9FLAO|nr:cation:proton antiporter [Flavobacterium bernardetii]MBC5833974.1 cation:proton antiporter [Flavobacterium bernardetii]NHF69206.1 cation/H(+) antiporter [Flavobacterium bernardetii]